ncbi:unnamed protein product [Ceutorhynchus assimilis]|uniref:Uncharacterized protein n=1 Tax=Ceutorhynchus assimilis TaxID=467358 RepID=A0A9N9MUA3_9CUCU|nr:unnamed protein product [Ceutorhynchus assimilis]
MGYEEGKNYKKTIKITNVSTEVIKLRFLELTFPNENESVPFEIERFGIKKLFTGSSIKFFVNFQPYDDSIAYDGNIAFVSYNISFCQYHRFEVGVQCLPKYLDLKIYPEILDFGDIPIWKAKNYDRAKVQNRGTKSCTIFIKKIFDPLDLELILEDEEDKGNSSLKSSTTSSTDTHVFDLLDDCIKNLENNFRFHPSFFSLDKMEEKRIKVFFKNASYVGDYLEKFTINVFENSTRETLQIAGCKLISLHAETTGHFLTTEPKILDFGHCIRNSCYQVDFQVFNNSRHSQTISIKVPSYLAEYVQSNSSIVYLGPMSKRVLYLKFQPRETRRQSHCSCLDTTNNILEFSIRLCVVSKIASDYPPVEVPVYAIITNSDDLSLSCNVSSCLSNFLSTLLVDMGDCSTYETQWFDLTLNNNTEVTQYCGFVNLPPVICPTKLKSGLDVTLQQLIAPDTELFRSIMESVSVLKKHIHEQPTQTTDSLVNRDMIIMSQVCSFFEKKFTYPGITQMSKTNQHDLAGRSFDDNLLDYHNFLIIDTVCRNEIWCKVNLKRPLLEFSHQIIEFPDTPCGSYSVMEVKLTARDREMEKPCQRKSKLEYRAHFEIVGNSVPTPNHHNNLADISLPYADEQLEIWSSPVWIVPTKEDVAGIQKWRMVVDYRKINEKTIGDRYPLTNITDTDILD